MDTAYFTSPVGLLKITATQTHLVQLDFVEEENYDPLSSRLMGFGDDNKRTTSTVLLQTLRELDEYFAGQRKKFTVPVAFERGTEFQRDVWSELTKIPFAQVITYGDQAKRIGRDKACRAVGLTNGKNPIAIIVPCHRVIGANGKLTGYASGLWRKQWLLDHERTVDQRLKS